LTTLVDHWVPKWNQVVFSTKKEKIMFIFNTRAFCRANIRGATRLLASTMYIVGSNPWWPLQSGVGKGPLFVKGEKECIAAYIAAPLINGCPDSQMIILAPGGSYQKSTKSWIKHSSG
jgi:hypothetical protein